MAEVTEVVTGTGIEDTAAPSTPWRAVSVVMAGAFMAILDTFIVLVALPAIQSGLRASDAQVQFVVAGYQLVYAVALITGARLGDRFGRRRMFLAGMGLFTLASAGCAAAPDAGALIGARLVQGLGAALMFPQVFSMIQVLVPAERRSRVLGVLGAVLGGASVAGQLVGGLLISANLFHSTWRPVFWVNVPVGLLTLALTVRWIPENSSEQTRRLDLAGAGVFSVLIALVIIPLIEGRQLDWPAWTWISLACGLAMTVVFVRVERRVAARGGSPLVVLRVFSERAFTFGILLILVVYAGLSSFFLVLSLVLQDGLHLSPLRAALAYTPEAVAFFSASLVAGRLGTEHGRLLLRLGALVLTVAYAATILVFACEGGRVAVAQIVPCLAVQGLGAGLVVTPLFGAILSRIRAEEVGTAAGVLSTTQQVGGSIGVAVIGVLFFDTLGRGAAGLAGYSHAFAVAVCFNAFASLIGIVLAVLLVRTPGQARR
jgi:EmrB/QacA subfamily drug resistance transporter